MKKALFWIIGIVIVLFACIMIGWNLLPTIVSSKLSKMTKTDVSIGSLPFTTQSIGIKDFEMGNPKGSVLKKALTVEEGKMQVPLMHLFKDDIVIEEIDLNNIYIGIEFEKKGSSEGNWSTIINNIEASSDTKEKEKKDSKSVLIQRLLLRDIDIELAYRKPKSIRKLKPIKRIELHNISSKGEFPSGVITEIIIREMIRNVFSLEGLQNLIQDVLNPRQGVEGVLDTIKGFFSKQQEEQEDAIPTS